MAKPRKKAAKAAAKVLVDKNDPRYILSEIEKEFEISPSDNTLVTALQEIADESQKRKVAAIKRNFENVTQHIEHKVMRLRDLRKKTRECKEQIVKLNDIRAAFLATGDEEKMFESLRKVM